MDPGAGIEEDLIPLSADLQGDIEPVKRGVVCIQEEIGCDLPEGVPPDHPVSLKNACHLPGRGLLLHRT
jgi:hypothetical protein